MSAEQRLDGGYGVFLFLLTLTAVVAEPGLSRARSWSYVVLIPGSVHVSACASREPASQAASARPMDLCLGSLGLDPCPLCLMATSGHSAAEVLHGCRGCMGGALCRFEP